MMKNYTVLHCLKKEGKKKKKRRNEKKKKKCVIFTLSTSKMAMDGDSGIASSTVSTFLMHCLSVGYMEQLRRMQAQQTPHPLLPA